MSDLAMNNQPIAIEFTTEEFALMLGCDYPFDDEKEEFEPPQAQGRIATMTLGPFFLEL